MTSPATGNRQIGKCTISPLEIANEFFKDWQRIFNSFEADTVRNTKITWEPKSTARH